MATRNKNGAANDERARKTLYVTGFNSKHTTKHLLKELFTQGGPVADVTMFDTHAYVLFQHEESVPYCLALFNEVELFGDKLRLNPRHRSKDTFNYMKYLTQVRDKLRDEYLQRAPPNLPAKKYSDSAKINGPKIPKSRSPPKTKRKEVGKQFLSNNNKSNQRDKQQVQKAKAPNSKSINKSSTTTPARSKTKRGRRGSRKKGERKVQRVVKTLRR